MHDIAADDPDASAAVATAVGFVRTLRAAGVGASAHRLQAFIAALGALDPSRRADVYWAGRVTLCGHQDDLGVYDRAFAAYFDGDDRSRGAQQRSPLAPQTSSASTITKLVEETDPESQEPVQLASASRVEVLRKADLARLTEVERDQARRLIASLRLSSDRRRTRRFERARRGGIDRGATVRAILRSHGELDHARYRRHRSRPRRLVVLVDISGSMEPYADALVRFAHAARQRGAPTEVFSLSTRLTRLTDELGHRDPDRAMAAVNARIADWSGGTRLGELLKVFLDVWGQRGMARGATIVILSDGWERDDPAVLAQQMERLSRLAHRVVWANPRRARPGFAPVAGGMVAALPHVDDFVNGHSVQALEHLARIVAGDRQRPGGSGALGR